MMKRMLLLASVAMLFTGCAWRTQIERGLVSTKPVDLDKKYEIDRSHKITGADRAHGIWLIPLGSPDADAAVTRTIDQASKQPKARKVVGLADVEVKFKLLWLYLYSQRWYSVEGYPIYEKQ